MAAVHRTLDAESRMNQIRDGGGHGSWTRQDEVGNLGPGNLRPPFSVGLALPRAVD